MTCKTIIEFKRPKICNKDLKHRITIQYRYTSTSKNFSTDSIPQFSDIGVYWAAIKTTPNTEPFSDVNQGNAITTNFYIRYNNSIDILKKLWIVYEDRRFEVINANDVDEYKRFILLRAKETGRAQYDSTKL